MKHVFESSKLDDPPADFCEWWNPSRRHNESGADLGGHHDAERVWARKDPGRWVHRTYGSNARTAWNTASFRGEYFRWIASGRPEREECRMFAAPLQDQQRLWGKLKLIIARIGNKMSEPEPFDYDPPTPGAKLEY